jgi:hypothetical protein
MKNMYIILFAFLVALSSCKDMDEMRINPNDVSETHPQLLLTNIEWNAFQVEGTGPLFASRMIVQTDGEQAEQFYTWTRGSFGDYSRLRDITKMIEEAERIEDDAYVALGLFFRSFYFYNLALTFGDVPYSEALMGETSEIYAPAYDNQKQVLIGVLEDLEDAAGLLSGDEIIEGDIIFDGSGMKWMKLINSFRLKVLLSLSEQEGDADLNLVNSFSSIVEAGNLMAGIADNGQIVFIDAVGNRYTEFNDSGYGSARYMDSTFVQRLIDREDPRLFIYCDQTPNGKKAGLPVDEFSSYEGGNPIAPYAEVNDKAFRGDISKVDLRYTTNPVTEPHMLMGYPELQFILAEAAVRGWISGDAASYYEEGVKASFQFYLENAAEYAQYVEPQDAEQYLTGDMVAFENAGNEEEQIELIITQKYLQTFLQSGWTMYYEHLRTGYPDFLTLPGVTPPTRWMYPNNEYLHNTDNVNDAISNQFGAGNDNTREITWWLK